MPSKDSVHVDAVLSRFSIGYRNAGYIADSLFPILKVKKESDKYWVFGKEAFRPVRTRRADKTRSARIEWGLSSESYYCEEYSVSAAISERERANADNGVELDRTTTETLTDMILLDRERRVAAQAVDAGVFTNNATPGTKWDAAASQDPIGDVLAAQEAMRIALRRPPNVMVLPPSVLYALKNCAVIVDQVKYTSNGRVTLQLLRDLFEMENILVPLAGYDTAEEGDTENIVDIYGDTVCLFYVAPQIGQREVTMGLTFRPGDFEVRKWDEKDIKCDVIEPAMREDPKVTCATAGYLLTDVLT